MSNRFRNVIFYALLGIFAVISGPIILYSYGYRYDFEKMTLTKIGGIFVRSAPASTEIYLNGKKIKNQSGILNSGTFITSLLPKTYDLKVSKEGYKDFKAKATVTALETNSFDKVRLIPEKSDKITSGDISAFYAKGDVMIIKDGSGKLHYKESIIPGNSVADISPTEKSVIISKSDKTEAILLVQLDKPEDPKNITDAFKTFKEKTLGIKKTVQINKIIAHPYDPQKAIISAATGLYIFDAQTGLITDLDGPVSDVMIAGGNIAIIRGDALDLVNPILKTETPLINVKDEKLISFSRNGMFAAVLWSSGMLETYNIKEDKSYRFDLKNISGIKKITWHGDDAHLFIWSDSGTYILETDKEIFKPELLFSPSTKVEYGTKGIYFTEDGWIKLLEF